MTRNTIQDSPDWICYSITLTKSGVVVRNCNEMALLILFWRKASVASSDIASRISMRESQSA